jgi:hypothetical protein
VLLERYVDAGRPWPCGTTGETTPALFLGLSGIGWLLLRLHDPATPSPLSPKPTVDNSCPLDVAWACSAALPMSM